MSVPHSINENTVTCIISGKIHTIQRDHPQVGQILKLLREERPESEVLAMFDQLAAVKSYMGAEGSVEVRGNGIYYHGEEIHSTVADRILEFMAADLPFKPLVRFLERLMENPSSRSREQLYSFLENENLPITPDGYFLAYKAIKSDWTDKWTGTVDNRIGQTPRMDRTRVDDDPGRSCSVGYHVGALSYVHSYASNHDRIILVKVDPEQVVCIPNDSEWQKVRTCSYKVIAEYKGPMAGTLADECDPYLAPDEVDEYSEEDVDRARCEGYDAGYQDGTNDVTVEVRAALDL